MTDLQEHLRARTLAALTTLGLDPAAATSAIVLQPPKNREHGDVALGCFQLAKLKGMAPPALATELAAKIAPDRVIERVAAAGPFVNFRFHRAALAEHVLPAVVKGEAPFGTAPQGKYTVVIDFSSLR